jgi:hypothetical protein
MYKFIRKRLAEIESRFDREFHRASSLYDGSSAPDAPEIKRLVRQTGVVLVLFCVLFGCVALSILLLAGRLSLLFIALGVLCFIGGIFQILRGKVLLPKAGPSKAGGGEHSFEAASASHVSECPNCEHEAYWTGEKNVEDGRAYLGMKCSHCFNKYWLYRSDTAGI